MSEFKPKEFYEEIVQSSDPRLLDKCKKSELLALGRHLELDVKPAYRKETIKNIILEHMVDEEICSSNVLKAPLSPAEYGAGAESIQEMKDTHERQMKELDFKMATQFREWELRMKEVEVEKAKVELEKHKAQVEAQERDIGRYLKFVPKFEEKEVEQFFLHFEKLAKQFAWKPESWVLLIQGSLVGRAQEVYTSLSIEDSKSYEKVKEAVLTAYELVPEAYRQKFRNCRKIEGQTYLEFARVKETLFDRWCRSRGVNSLDKLRELMLVEEFKRCVFSDLRTHLDERGVSDLGQAAMFADSYVLTHHKVRGQPSDSDRNRHKTTQSKTPNAGFARSQSLPRNPEPRPEPSAPVRRLFKKCTFCQKEGHVREECYSLKRKAESTKTIKPEGLVARPTANTYVPFMSEGIISSKDLEGGRKVTVLRDTGASQSLLLEGVVPPEELTPLGENILLKGIGGYLSVPLYRVHMESNLKTGNVDVGVVKSLPVENVQFLAGNDFAGGQVFPCPRVREHMGPVELYSAGSADDGPDCCAVTRSQTKKPAGAEAEVSLEGTWFSRMENSYQDKGEPNIEQKAELERLKLGWSRDKLIQAQKSDGSLTQVRKEVLDLEDLEEVPVGYYVDQGVLMRKYRPPFVPASEDWKTLHQVVLPAELRQPVMSLAHDHPMAGHLGVAKTVDRVTQHFYWPRVRKDVIRFCGTCHVCQKVGKPNQKIPKALLRPIPAFEEPFSRVIIDCVGPLPRTKAGNEYLLTVMCASSRFPEAIPLRNIKAQTVVKALVKFKMKAQNEKPQPAIAEVVSIAARIQSGNSAHSRQAECCC